MYLYIYCTVVMVLSGFVLQLLFCMCYLMHDSSIYFGTRLECEIRVPRVFSKRFTQVSKVWNENQAPLIQGNGSNGSSSHGISQCHGSQTNFKLLIAHDWVLNTYSSTYVLANQPLTMCVLPLFFSQTIAKWKCIILVR